MRKKRRRRERGKNKENVPKEEGRKYKEEGKEKERNRTSSEGMRNRGERAGKGIKRIIVDIKGGERGCLDRHVRKDVESCRGKCKRRT